MHAIIAVLVWVMKTISIWHFQLNIVEFYFASLQVKTSNARISRESTLSANKSLHTNPKTCSYPSCPCLVKT
jgi:hypothetical protein